MSLHDPFTTEPIRCVNVRVVVTNTPRQAMILAWEFFRGAVAAWIAGGTSTYTMLLPTATVYADNQFSTVNP